MVYRGLVSSHARNIVIRRFYPLCFEIGQSLLESSIIDIWHATKTTGSLTLPLLLPLSRAQSWLFHFSLERDIYFRYSVISEISRFKTFQFGTVPPPYLYSVHACTTIPTTAWRVCFAGSKEVCRRLVYVAIWNWHIYFLLLFCFFFFCRRYIFLGCDRRTRQKGGIIWWRRV